MEPWARPGRTLPCTSTGGPCTCFISPSAAPSSDDLPLPVWPTTATSAPAGMARSMSTSDAAAPSSHVNSPASRTAVSPGAPPGSRSGAPRVPSQRAARLGMPPHTVCVAATLLGHAEPHLAHRALFGTPSPIWQTEP